MCALGMCLDTRVQVFPVTRESRTGKEASMGCLGLPRRANRSQPGKTESTPRFQGLEKQQVAHQHKMHDLLSNWLNPLLTQRTQRQLRTGLAY